MVLVKAFAKLGRDSNVRSLLLERSCLAMQLSNRREFIVNVDNKSEPRRDEEQSSSKQLYGSFGHLEKLSINSELSEPQRRRLLQTLVEHRSAVSWNNSDLKQTDAVEHAINTGQHGPVRSQPHRQTPELQVVTKRFVEHLKSKDVIEDSRSSWSSPVILIPKKDNSFRLYVDYQKLNRVTVRDDYCAPGLDEMSETLLEARYFTTLDLGSGYWQCRLKRSDREKTTFVTPLGLFQFKVMPFGLANAASTFQRLMSVVLSDMIGRECLVYLDRVIVFGRSFDEHDARLSDVLARFMRANLKIKPAGCSFAMDHVDFLGFRVSQQGLRASEERIDAIKNMPAPTSLALLRRFLNMITYYDKFIDELEQKALPLTEMLAKVEFRWDARAQAAFEHLKECLVTAPVLQYPNPKKQYILQCDASLGAIGCVLSQHNDHDQEEHPVAYASRNLTNFERRYSTSEREALAIVWATRTFKPYIYGQHFKVVTDHQSLVSYKRLKKPDGKLGNLFCEIQHLDFDLTFRKGVSHANADTLSRVNFVDLPGVNWRAEQSKCAELARLRDEVAHRRPISAADYADLGAGLKLNAQGVLIKLDNEAEKILVPKAMRLSLFNYFHEGEVGQHLDLTLTTLRICKQFYWPKIGEDVARFADDCQFCKSHKALSKPTNKPRNEKFRVSEPWELVTLNILGPYRTLDKRLKYVVVATDAFTKYSVAGLTSSTDGHSMSSFLFENVISRFGRPARVVNSCDTELEPVFIKELNMNVRILGRTSSELSSSFKEHVERQSRIVASIVHCFLKENPLNWEQNLSKTLYMYNTTVHAQTGYAPFQALFGRDPTTATVAHEPQAKSSYVDKIKTAHEHISKSMVSCTPALTKKQKSKLKHKNKYCKFREGDLVLVRAESAKKARRAPKNQRRKFRGPYMVVKPLGEYEYLVKSSAFNYQVFNLRLLKKFKSKADAKTAATAKKSAKRKPKQARLKAKAQSVKTLKKRAKRREYRNRKL